VPSRGRHQPLSLALSDSSRHKQTNQTKQSKGKTPPPPHLVVCFSSVRAVRHKPPDRLPPLLSCACVVAVCLVAAPVMVMVEMDGGVGGGGGGGQTPAPRRWRLADERCDLRAMETDYVRRFHRHEPREHQCSSAVAKHIKAPVHLVSACLSTSLSRAAESNINLRYAFSPRRAVCIHVPWRRAGCSCCCPVDPPQRHRFHRVIGFSFCLAPSRPPAGLGLVMRCSLIRKDADLLRVSHPLVWPVSSQ
jgi:hypothetical protein